MIVNSGLKWIENYDDLSITYGSIWNQNDCRKYVLYAWFSERNIILWDSI